MILLPAVLLMAGAVSAPDLGTRFVELLEQDDIGAVTRTAVAGAELASPDFYELRDAIDRYECIDVRAVKTEVESSTDTSVTLRVDLTAIGTTAGGLKHELQLWPRWFVRFVRDGDTWRLQSARTYSRMSPIG